MGDVYTFGPMLLDLRARRLLRDGTPIDLPAIQFALLQALVERAGHVVTKEELMAIGWGQAIVEDNTLAKTMLRLRRAMDADPKAYIATASRQGYRFHADAARVVVPRSDADARDDFAPYRAFVDGRALLVTLDSEKVSLARRLFEQAVRRNPDDAANHVGLANAQLLQYEHTRMDTVPDRALLLAAAASAREACRLSGQHAEAAATLGFVLFRLGEQADATAAARRAIALEDGNWRHHARLGWMSWGEDRLAAVRRIRAIVALPFADLLAATVAIARDHLDAAAHEIEAGRRTLAHQGAATDAYATVGLDLVAGLLAWARGDEPAAFSALEAEAARASSGHLFAREYAAHALSAIGGCRCVLHDRPGARDAFERAVTLAPRHPMARAGLAIVSSTTAEDALRLVARQAEAAMHGPGVSRSPFDAATAQAAVLAHHGHVESAASLVADALMTTSGSTGWMIPIEPLLGVQRQKARWARALGILEARAR